MSDRGIQFNPAPANARDFSSIGQPIAVPSRVVVPELEAESGKGAKPIATAPLKSAENQRVFKLPQDYVNSHYSYKNTNNRDLRKYLERQYYTKKAGISTGEEEDPVEEFIRKRKAAKVTRRSAKTRARKAIYEQYKDQGVYESYPNCEYLLQQQYMSEEEDMYNNDTIDKERMSVLCKKTVDYFEVRVPKYRSPACTEFFKLLDDQIASDKAKRQRTGNSSIQFLPRIQRKCSLPVPDFIKKENITEETIAWAFGGEIELDEINLLL
ncbi:hypothetical protein G6F38_013117 [Rhizopus arrhizus]|nr:hypothetical protein G6F38_013117 [Rhizopus arrhizus]